MSQIEYHIQLGPGQVGRYVFLPGSPDRVERIARLMDNPKRLAQNREYTTWEATLEGERVAVMSTGIGGPSAAIGIQELARIGADTFIRPGTCGKLQKDIALGDLIVPYGMVRGGATASSYVPIEFPAVADPRLHIALVDAAEQLGLTHHTGIAHCKDAFFLEEPDCLPLKQATEVGWDVWRRAGVLASEMESDTLFAVGSVLGLRVASVLLAIGDLSGESDLDLTLVKGDKLDGLLSCAIEGMRRMIIADRG